MLKALVWGAGFLFRALGCRASGSGFKVWNVRLRASIRIVATQNPPQTLNPQLNPFKFGFWVRVGDWVGQVILGFRGLAFRV